MTPHQASISSELLRISSYAGVMSRLANNGNSTKVDTAQLQTIFSDIAKVTGLAYAEIQSIINDDCPFVDNYDKPPMPSQTGN